MNLIQKQITNEFKSKHHLASHVKEDLINSGLEYLATKYVNILEDHVKSMDYSYVTQAGERKEWTSKKERHINLLQMDLEELAWAVIATTTTEPVQSYTACVGMLKGMFKNDTVRQDIEQASECIALVKQIGVIDIILPRNTEEGTLMVHSKIKYDGELGAYLSNIKHILPSLVKPKVVQCNKDSGYQTFGSSVILAGKYHDKPVPLDHINRVNSVALSINPKAIEIEPVFDEKYGETPAERLQRFDNWSKTNRESVEIYADLINSGNRFHITYNYCERLRTYAHGHHVNTQGDSRRKSVLELANKELVRM